MKCKGSTKHIYIIIASASYYFKDISWKKNSSEFLLLTPKQKHKKSHLKPFKLHSFHIREASQHRKWHCQCVHLTLADGERWQHKGTWGRSRVYFYFKAKTASAEHNSEIKHTAFTAALHWMSSALPFFPFLKPKLAEREGKSQSCWRKVPWGWQSLRTGLLTAPGGYY